jgi:hypothetical protein
MVRLRSPAPHRIVATTCTVAVALAGVHLVAQWIAQGELRLAWESFTRAWTNEPVLLGLGWLAISVAVGTVSTTIRRGGRFRRRKPTG